MVVSNILVQWFFLVCYYLIEYWIDIPNLQTVRLPDSFEKVEIKSITSIYMNMNEWIDVSPILANLVQIRNSDIIVSSTTGNSNDDCTILFYSCCIIVDSAY